jgi:hypothetical protein
MGIRGCRIEAFSTERITEDLTPSTQMTEAAAFGARHKLIPRARVTVERHEFE